VVRWRLLLGDGKERILETVGRRGLFDAGLKGGNGLLDGGRVEGVGGLCGSGCAIRRYSWKLLLLLRLLLLLHHVVVHGLGCVWGIVMGAQWRGAARPGPILLVSNCSCSCNAAIYFYCLPDQ
jgi:hypothetical protein